MSARRASRDPEHAEHERREQALHELQQWGLWAMTRVDGGTGYGPSVLANLQRAGRSSDFYRAPVNEVNCSEIDDAINELGREHREIAVAHFGRGFSYGFIARGRRMAPQTVARRIDDVIRCVVRRLVPGGRVLA